MRLRILQQVLGLDTRFSRDVVHGVICLAFDVIEEMSGGASHSSAHASPRASPKASPQTRRHFAAAAAAAAASPSSSSSSRPASPSMDVGIDLDLGGAGAGAGGAASAIVGEGLDLDGFDEATRLEADALLGPARPRSRPSDPMGEQSRRGRIAYHYR